MFRFDVGLWQVHCGGAANCVRTDLSRQERRRGSRGLGRSMSDDVTEAEPGKSIPFDIDEERYRVAEPYS